LSQGRFDRAGEVFGFGGRSEALDDFTVAANVVLAHHTGGGELELVARTTIGLVNTL
jgi:hypothetical protein